MKGVTVGCFVGLALLATAQLASAAALNRSLVGSRGPVQAGLVWGGGNRVAPPSGAIQQQTARPAYLDWQPSYTPSPVNRFDWSAWFGWLGVID